MQPVEFPGSKVHTCMLADSTFDGSVTNLLSTLSIFIEIFSRAHAKGQKGLNGFKFGILLVVFRGTVALI